MYIHLYNGRGLGPDGSLTHETVTFSDPAGNGRIGTVGGRAPADALCIDAKGALILPGIVDLHGDAFERQLMPRPGVDITPPVALIETDRQLLANGVTTAFHALTWSWEPGLRSRDAGLAFIAALKAIRPRLDCDTRLHLRHETYNLEGEAALVDLIVSGGIDLLAINDHTPGMAAKTIDQPETLSSTAARSGLTLDEFIAELGRIVSCREDVPGSVARICAAAWKMGLPMASHDDGSPEVRAEYAMLGGAICEFPTNVETARAARDSRASVILGAPNVLRGGSHTGFVGAADMVGQELCDVLVSDYYYPALPAAPFRLVSDGVCDFATAWSLVSANPAAAAGLADRGALAPGQRADIVIVDDSDAAAPRVVTTFVSGKAAFYAAGLDRIAAADMPARLSA